MIEQWVSLLGFPLISQVFWFVGFHHQQPLTGDAKTSLPELTKNLSPSLPENPFAMSFDTATEQRGD
jgi:hypothetical protein